VSLRALRVVHITGKLEQKAGYSSDTLPFLNVFSFSVECGLEVLYSSIGATPNGTQCDNVHVQPLVASLPPYHFTFSTPKPRKLSGLGLKLPTRTLELAPAYACRMTPVPSRYLSTTAGGRQVVVLQPLRMVGYSPRGVEWATKNGHAETAALLEEARER